MWKFHTNGYFELQAEQRTIEWFNARRRVTGSIVEKALGWCKYTSEEELLNDILGISKPKEITEAMQRGIDGEDPLRNKFFEEVASTRYNLIEPSLCIGTTIYDFPMKDGRMFSEIYGTMRENPLHPQWFIGSSPDGLLYKKDTNILTSILECKCTDYLYPEVKYNMVKVFPVKVRYPHLLSLEDKMKTKKNFSPSDNICIEQSMKLSHYLQMQTEMLSTRTSSGYYLVGYDLPEPGYEYRFVTFERRLWQNVIFPGLCYFITERLIPRMKELSMIQTHVSTVKEMIETNPVFTETLIPY